MGLFDRLEAGLERAVNGTFAKAFRSEVQPVEIASAIRRAMDDRAASSSAKGRSLVPNVFTIELSARPTTTASPTTARTLEEDLVAAAEEHADGQRYQPGRPDRHHLRRARRPRDRRLPDPPVRPRSPRATGHDRSAAAVPPPDHDATRMPVESTGRGAAPAARPVATPAQPPRCRAARPDHRARSTDDELERRPRHHAPARRRRQQSGSTRPTGPGSTSTASATRSWAPSPILGRDDSADIILDDPGISRRHSEIRVTHRRAALRHDDPRPRLDQRHLRQRRADHQRAPRGRRPGHRRPHLRHLPRGPEVTPADERAHPHPHAARAARAALVLRLRRRRACCAATSTAPGSTPRRVAPPRGNSPRPVARGAAPARPGRAAARRPARQRARRRRPRPRQLRVTAARWPAPPCRCARPAP